MLTKLDIYRPDHWKVEWKLLGPVSGQTTTRISPVLIPNTVPLVRQIIYRLGEQALNQSLSWLIALVSRQLLEPASFQVYLRVSNTLLAGTKAATKC